MVTYKTAEVAAVIGVHPNTVRLYEEWGLIPAAKRQANGYRVFTAFHIQQFWLARTAFQIEVLQGGLRKKIVAVVKLSAQNDFDGAILLTQEYISDLGKERDHAEEAIRIVQHILSGDSLDTPVFLKRKEVSDYLGISMDTLRNWEMNGLLTVKRKQNGYRVYSERDIKRLKIIRSLRCANYSLEAILRMLQQLSKNPNTDIKLALNTPRQDDDIISVCAGGLMGLPLVVAEYRERKILKRFQVTPISPGMLLAVEFLIYVLYALVSLITLLLLSRLAWGVQLRGSWAGFVSSWLLTVFSTLSIGVMVGGIARNAKSASVIACVLYFPMLIFSGATLPFEVMPEVMQKIISVFPMTQGIQLMKTTFLGLTVEQAVFPVIVMLCVTVICAGIAVKCFKWE